RAQHAASLRAQLSPGSGSSRLQRAYLWSVAEAGPIVVGSLQIPESWVVSEASNQALWAPSGRCAIGEMDLDTFVRSPMKANEGGGDIVRIERGPTFYSTMHGHSAYPHPG